MGPQIWILPTRKPTFGPEHFIRDVYRVRMEYSIALYATAYRRMAVYMGVRPQPSSYTLI